MSYPISYPTPQGANVQIFRGGDTNTAAHVVPRDWVKPQGASFVFFTLIGGGGGGGGNYYSSSPGDRSRGGGGASGNVTNFMCPAFFLPDVLQVAVGKGGAGAAWAGADVPGNNGSDGLATRIVYQQKAEADYLLLAASGGGGGLGSPNGSTPGTGGTASGVNAGGPMTAAGFYSSTAGQNGATNNEITTNGLTFLLGGSGDSTLNQVTGYYGYKATPAVGYAQIQPIIQSISGGAAKSPFGAGGCGADPDLASGRAPDGGDGMVIIVTW
jgi:hypothetical protein